MTDENKENKKPVMVDVEKDIDSEIDKLLSENISQEELMEVADQEEMVPKMNINLPENQPCFITDNRLDDVYEELLKQGREDRGKMTEMLDQFLEMVINDGDGSSASKEAVVNLIKARSDVTDKMAKVADLMTRIKLRERDTFPKYLAAKQENNYNFSSADKKALLSDLNKRIKKVKGNSNDE